MNQKENWENKYSSRKEKPVNDFARKALTEINKKGLKKVLEIGCGFGQDSEFFAENDLSVTAIDFSKKAIGLAKKHKNINYILMDTSVDLNKFKKDSFDIIYAHLSLHYFDDKTTKKVFRELYNILKSGGLFFVKCKSIDDPLFGEGQKIEENMFLRQEHVRHFFSKEYMKKCLEKFNLINIEKTEGNYSGYPSRFIEAIATK